MEIRSQNKKVVCSTVLSPTSAVNNGAVWWIKGAASSQEAFQCLGCPPISWALGRGTARASAGTSWVYPGFCCQQLPEPLVTPRHKHSLNTCTHLGDTARARRGTAERLLHESPPGWQAPCPEHGWGAGGAPCPPGSEPEHSAQAGQDLPNLKTW